MASKKEIRLGEKRGVRAKFYRERGSVYVEIRIIGDSAIYRGKATDTEKLRFPNEWKEFETGKTTRIVGTPLTELDGVTPELANLYREQEVRTCEELVALSDAAVRNIGILDAANLRKRAQERLGHGRA